MTSSASNEQGTEGRGPAYEVEHVHSVYDRIASHFSSTRYKPWPIVDRYLKNLPTGSVGVDVGCGNGKYLSVNNEIFIVASDRSEKLVDIASKHTHHTAVVADSLSLPHPLARFDFGISIAVTHHLSTPDRRVDAVRSLLDVLKPAGTALVFVWALEQKDSRRGWDHSDDQDVMVPWVTVSKSKQGSDSSSSEKQIFHRYYHLYKAGELEDDIAKAGGIVVESGYEKDNWWAIARPAR